MMENDVSLRVCHFPRWHLDPVSEFWDSQNFCLNGMRIWMEWENEWNKSKIWWWVLLRKFREDVNGNEMEAMRVEWEKHSEERNFMYFSGSGLSSSFSPHHPQMLEKKPSSHTSFKVNKYQPPTTSLSLSSSFSSLLPLSLEYVCNDKQKDRFWRLSFLNHNISFQVKRSWNVQQYEKNTVHHCGDHYRGYEIKYISNI